MNGAKVVVDDVQDGLGRSVAACRPRPRTPPTPAATSLTRRRSPQPSTSPSSSTATHDAYVMAPGLRDGGILCTTSVVGVLSSGYPILTNAICKATVIVAALVNALSVSPRRDGGAVSMAEIFPSAGEDALTRVVEEDWRELDGTVLEVEDVVGRRCTWRRGRT